jgi:hypothetical protein
MTMVSVLQRNRITWRRYMRKASELGGFSANNSKRKSNFVEL